MVLCCIFCLQGVGAAFSLKEEKPHGLALSYGLRRGLSLGGRTFWLRGVEAALSWNQEKPHGFEKSNDFSGGG